MAPKVEKKPKKKTSTEAEDDLEEWKKSKQLLKPKDQLELQDAELKEIIARNLVMTNIQVPDNIVEFSYADGAFNTVPFPSNIVVVFEMHGTCIRKDSDEARDQMLAAGIDPMTIMEMLEDVDSAGSVVTAEETELEKTEETTDHEGDEEMEGEEGEEGDEEGEHEEAHEGEEVGEGAGAGEETKQEEGEEESPAPTKGKKLTNQFNFCERAALTYNLPARTQETQTVPPPVKSFAANVLQWVIYDAYLVDYEAQMLEKERERERKEMGKAPVAKAGAGPPRKTKQSKGAKKDGLSEAVQGRVFECWKVLERMINLNTFDEIAKDYRYWEDPSDEYREEEGTLLPLWKYSYENTKKHTVTYLVWNPWYYDLFIVCYGYLDFLKPMPEGYICLFTIKNPSYPESIIVTQSAVMCADVHKTYPYMLVVGLFDGNIQVYNVHASCKKPAFETKTVEGKHCGITWAVKWVPDLPDGELNFFSVANDGKVNNYVLMQSELDVTTIFNLYLDKDESKGPDGTMVRMKACATYILLHPKNPTIYLVGTEEGNIYKCSVNYSSQYLLTYKAHHMPVYKIDYNKYNSDIFISCSSDWRIKIWEDDRLDPLFVFDLGTTVADVEWAPYSSTVFAAVTSEGKVYVFDLNVNKYKFICTQAVVSKKRNRLTTIGFNHNLPIIIVGDDKGTVTALKLSPNLRIPCKPPKKQQHLDQWTMQCMKLDRLLALVREPAVLTVNVDATSNAS